MVGLLDQLRKKVISSVGKGEDKKPSAEIDNKIALGVLMWAVAEADDKFLPEENEKIEEVLRTYIQISDEDMPIVLNTIEIASIERIDLHKLTREIGQNLSYPVKLNIVENLFRVACVDKDLDHEETETIRKIANLLKIEHKDFIDSKIKIKKDFGLDTAGL